MYFDVQMALVCCNILPHLLLARACLPCFPFRSSLAQRAALMRASHSTMPIPSVARDTLIRSLCQFEFANSEGHARWNHVRSKWHRAHTTRTESRPVARGKHKMEWACIVRHVVVPRGRWTIGGILVFHLLFWRCSLCVRERCSVRRCACMYAGTPIVEGEDVVERVARISRAVGAHSEEK